MRNYLLGTAALLLATAAPAFADDQTAPATPAPAPAPTPEITINGTVALVSDYRFRGTSQTDGTVAVQGGATITDKSGFYLSFWGSSVDTYITAKTTGHQELDLIAGYSHTFKTIKLDGGVLYYVYPGKHYLPGDNSSSNFFEPYADISDTVGPLTMQAEVNWAPKQKALGVNCQGCTGDPSHSNFYAQGNFTLAIPKSPLALTAHIGHTWGPSWLSLGKEYTDWSLGATVTWKQLTLGIAYVDTDAHHTLITPEGRDAGGATAVGSATFAF